MTALSGALPGARRQSLAVRFDALSAALIALGCFVMLASAYWGIGDRAVTSDEALYLSEAVSISQGRIDYASGDPIVHRPPLYAATLAPVMRATGNDVDAARIVPVLYALGALGALYWLGRVTVGTRAAAASVCLAGIAAYPAHMSAAFFTDTPAVMWLLASCAMLLTALRGRNQRAMILAGGAGVLLGLSFLTKETAAAWLPLPVLLVLLIERRPMALTRIALFYAAAGVTVAPWFAWVAAHGGGVFKLDASTVAAGAVTALGAVVLTAALLRSPALPGRLPRGIIACAMAGAWCGLMLYVLESRPEPQPIDYVRTVPDWLRTVFTTNVEPWPLIAAAWAYAGWRAVRGNDGARVIVAVAALGLPMLVYAANRHWEPRQAMPLIYVSYLVLGWAALHAIDTVAATWRGAERRGFALAVLCAMALIAGYASGLGPRDAAASMNWRNPQEAAIAEWVRALPDGSSAMSSRLYYAQLYVDADGRIPVRQLPTLGVTVDDGGDIRPFGTLFRYADAATDLESERHWMYVREYSGRPYAIGLAEEDLIAEIRRHGITHVLLTGEDAGFSSLSLRVYFDWHPAFTHVESSGSDGPALYAVDHTKLDATHPALAMTFDDIAYVSREAGAVAETAAYWRALAPSGVLVAADRLLTPDQAAALAAEMRTSD